jgi:hypothetical protein
MALKGKKLHPDGIQGIRGFAMAYKGLATFTMAYKELALLRILHIELIQYLVNICILA